MRRELETKQKHPGFEPGVKNENPFLMMNNKVYTNPDRVQSESRENPGQKPDNPQKPAWQRIVRCLSNHEDTRASELIHHYKPLTFDAVLIPVKPGTKQPLLAGWQHLNLNDTIEEEHIRLLLNNNIAVSTGKPSNGLISIDLDSDDAEKVFRQVNPELTDRTLRSQGSRGCNFWFKIEGDYPEGVLKIADEGGKAIGELRAGSGVTVFHGIHPDGMHYTNNGKQVEHTSFDEIIWPKEWILPWEKDAYDVLKEEQGEPFSLSRSGDVTLNEPWFVSKYKMEHEVVYVPEMGSFYEYNESSGLWSQVTKARVMAQFSNDINDAANKFGHPSLQRKRTIRLLQSLEKQLEGSAEKRRFFEVEHEGHHVHLEDGMLHITATELTLLPFDSEYRSLSQIPIPFDENANCPRFKQELLDQALAPEDQLLLQKYFGQILLGKNLTQTILIIEGGSLMGKGTVTEVLDGIIGEENVAELRTKLLGERFEVASYHGKKLLAGRDVSGDFLNTMYASALKKLTGGDLLSGEMKGVNLRLKIRGTFCAIMTTNKRLIVNIDGDKTAWRRRLLIVNFDRQGPSKPIPEFSRLLLNQESPGILRWMIAGAQLLLQDIEKHGVIAISPEQSRRVSDLLNESDSVSMFVNERITPDPASAVTTRELNNEYRDFCQTKGFDPVSEKQFERQVKPEITDVHKAHASENIEVYKDVRVRGYRGVRLIQERAR